MYGLYWVHLHTTPGRACAYAQAVAVFSDRRTAAEYAAVWQPRNNSVIGYTIRLQFEPTHTTDRSTTQEKTNVHA